MCSLKRQRDRADRADVLRDVVAALAVAARGGQHELAALVAEIDRDAVDFRIDEVAAGDREASRVGLGEPLRTVAQFAAPLFGLRRRPCAPLPARALIASSLGSMASYARAAHLRRSAASYVLSIENIGRAWATVRKPSIGSPPTRCVGLSGVISSGWAASRSRSSREKLVVFAVGNRRRGVDVVAPIVLADLVAELGDLLVRCDRFVAHVRREYYV